ncbi:glycosyltransferase family 2 protein [Aequorivita xiaoshiensis]|uniref:Glycosyltransferase n=1 Tax=Aequorivita xiaoshiensis TaxID=2874476 RepID=A0A9X1R280_9FLAO|nr:glycosyltransferase family 2 protein [Aequorivita xiaoshiensis]MCG2430487.1 glycosyltransferase [Aequorivita xiaoshiensis]
MNNPLISIIIPTYNRANLIGETLMSIQNQTYQNWECIVVDDRSTDNTEEVINEFCKADNRIQYFKKPSHLLKGPSAARNYGVERSKGEYINFFDSDDLMHPQKLEVDLINIQSGSYDFTISQSQFFKEGGSPTKKFWNNELWSDDPINDFIIKKIGWGVNSPLWKKECLIEHNLHFDEKLITGDDYIFHIKALNKGMIPYVNKDILVQLKIHNNRLNELKNKSRYKLKIAYSLLTDKSLKLNRISNDRLVKMGLRQLSNSFKNKDIKNGLSYSFKFLFLKAFKNYKIMILRLLLFGIVYRVTGTGYNFLQVNFNSIL